MSFLWCYSKVMSCFLILYQGYGAPPTSQPPGGYGAPPVSQPSYGAPPVSQPGGYGAPPTSQPGGYGAPPAQGGYGAPPQQQQSAGYGGYGQAQGANFGSAPSPAKYKLVVSPITIHQYSVWKKCVI